jgi:UDP-glucose 4-epimerase
MVVPRLIVQALSNEPLTVYGDGLQTRTFTGVKDVVQVFMGMIEKDESYGQVFNIGGTEEISILDLAKKIIALSGSKSEIVLTPYEEAYEADFEDMMRRVPSVEKVFNLVGFKPDDNLDSILQNIITFMSD